MIKRVNAFLMLVLSVLLYGSTYVASSCLAQLLCADWIVGAMMLSYVLSIVFLAFFYKNKDRTPLLFPDSQSSKKCLYFLPMCPAVISNVFFVDRGTMSVGSFMLILAVSAGEELLFRYYLLGALGKRGAVFGALLSSALFSVMHLANLLSNSDIAFVLLQAVTAFAIGLCFSLTVVITKRVGVCILIHFLINLSGMGELRVGWHAASAVCIGVYLLYALHLFRYLRRKTISLSNNEVDKEGNMT